MAKGGAEVETVPCVPKVTSSEPLVPFCSKVTVTPELLIKPGRSASHSSSTLTEAPGRGRKWPTGNSV
jgi:hypothetical protein